MTRAWEQRDLPYMISIWNAIVEEGNAFPQDRPLDYEGALEFFKSQSYTGVAERNGEIAGLYILHPNNVGRCGHIANASYAVSPSARNEGIGRELVSDSLTQSRRLGFRILQFNAVVASNQTALHLYESLGFRKLGRIPGGFRRCDGSFEDIIPHYIELA